MDVDGGSGKKNSREIFLKNQLVSKNINIPPNKSIKNNNMVESEKNKINEGNNKISLKNIERSLADVMINNKVGVDGTNILKEFKNNKFSEESNCWNNHWKKNEIARERWKMLAKTLLKPKRISSISIKIVKDISVRRFTSFELITPDRLDLLEKVDDRWFKYNTKILNNKYWIEIHHLQQQLTAKELMGFNNTGNICIWPSEEILTFYILSNVDLFQGKEILEIGGGMTCLAGVALSKYGKPKKVHLTDGNTVSVENVQKIIGRNQLDETKVSAYQLNWNDYGSIKDKFDVVLSADCLFFDETRSVLVETIWHSLKDGGVALVMAPRRGNTLDSFVQQAVNKGFCCILQTYYHEIVWKQHVKFIQSRPETEYWVSTGRKFCDFCKCSIADNKPSIQFHENGKKHKENVAKRLVEMRKKATKEAKTTQQVNKQLKKMESAALQAYLRDIESTPDFQSESIRKAVAEAEAEKKEKEREREEQKKKKQESAESSKPKSKKRWLEGITEDGKKYYYNLNTGESSDEPPPQGYKSLAEQEFKRDKLEQKRSKLDVAVKNEEIYRPKFKPVTWKTEEFGPTDQSSSHPYGAWKRVEPEPEPVDLQLPSRPEYIPIVVPTLTEEPERKFKEKKLAVAGSLESFSGETSFKKRKFSGNPKKNMRQRLDDE